MIDKAYETYSFERLYESIRNGLFVWSIHEWLKINNFHNATIIPHVLAARWHEESRASEHLLIAVPYAVVKPSMTSYDVDTIIIT